MTSPMSTIFAPRTRVSFTLWSASSSPMTAADWKSRSTSRTPAHSRCLGTRLRGIGATSASRRCRSTECSVPSTIRIFSIRASFRSVRPTGRISKGRTDRRTMDLDLDNKVAVVTGGSRGIGKAMARALAREGADVALIARNLKDCEATATAIATESARTVRAYDADTGDDEAVRLAFEKIIGDFGRLDILINAAAKPGGQAPPPSLMEITNENFWSDVNVKVLGYVRCARAAVPHMLKARSGRIINISGLAARSTGTIIGSIRNISVAALTKNF